MNDDANHARTLHPGAIPSSEVGRALGLRSGAIRRGQRRLTLERVTEELGELETLADAQRWLRQIALWAAGGLLHGAVAHASTRAVEIWIKAHDAKLTREVVDGLRARLDVVEGAQRDAGATWGGRP